MEKIALTGPFDANMQAAIRKALPAGFEVVLAPKPEEFGKLQDVEYIIIRTVEFREKIIKTLPKLKFIQRWGVGYDIIDIKAAGEQNIPVAVMPGINATQVAELTLLLILAVYRNLIAMHNGILEGQWPRNEFMKRSYTVNGKTVGLVGIGNIGRKVARLIQAFDTDVQYYDVFRLSAEQEAELGVRYVAFEELLKTSDIISLHIPVTDENKGLINKKTIALMKPTAVVINTARGELIDEADLFEALKSDRLLGAGLDVFEHEPLGKESPLRSVKNVVMTPHVGGNTLENNLNMARRAIENILKISSGKGMRADELVNGQFLRKQAK
ncbi:MAG: 2-hydroxyacid dehydrogenase [Thermodesulfobacteriota bacterium]